MTRGRAARSLATPLLASLAAAGVASLCASCGPPCGVDADCPEGSGCREGFCATECARDEDCPLGTDCGPNALCGPPAAGEVSWVSPANDGTVLAASVPDVDGAGAFEEYPGDTGAIVCG